MLRNQVLTLMLVGAVLGLAQLAMAQAATPPAATPTTPPHVGRLMKWTLDMKLTDDQVTKIRALLKTEHQSVMGVLTDDQRAQLQAAHETFKEEYAKLGLTADQKAKIKAIHEDTAAKAKAIDGNATLAVADKQTQLKALHQATHQQIDALLTPDQLTELQEAIKDRVQNGKIKDLNLTKDQHKQIRTIRQQTRADIRALLTTDQQAIWDQLPINQHRTRTNAKTKAQ